MLKFHFKLRSNLSPVLLCWIQHCGDLGFYEGNIFCITIYFHNLAVCGTVCIIIYVHVKGIIIKCLALCDKDKNIPC